MALLRWIFGFSITIIVAFFAAMNTQSVPFQLSPFHNQIDIPIYVVALGSMTFGFVFGGFLVWLNGAKTRKERRRFKKEIKILEKQLEHIKSEGIVKTNAPELETLPARDLA